LKRGQYSFPNIAFNGLQGSDQVGQEASQVVVAFVQRKPGDTRARPAASDPFAQQRRLAKAGWCGDEGQLAVKPRVQLLDQAGTRDQLWADGWDIEFGG
jgi:hypothetical protein